MPSKRPQLKICGNRDVIDIRTVAPYLNSIAHIGFIFTPVSKRYVDAQTVQRVLADFPSVRSKAVGVFMDQTISEIESVVKTCGLQTVQLHGNESPSLCQQLQTAGLTVWKTIPVSEDRCELPIADYTPHCSAILLDTKVKGRTGGTGHVFAWSIIPDVQKQLQFTNCSLWVAGGISDENIESLIRTYDLAGIDIASGAESNGKKDAARVQAIIKGVSTVGRTNE